MALRRRVIYWLAATLLLVYWGLGLPFTLLYLNFDPQQLPWILVPYLWEVPLLGFLLVLLPVWRALEPVDAFENGSQEDQEKVLHVALHLPLQVVPVVVGASIMGYAMGSLQLRLFGHLPLRETIKNLVLGLPTGLLYGLLAYFILSNVLRAVVERLEHGRPAEGPRVPLFWKTWACFFVLTVIAVTVMGLLSYSSSQRLLEANLVRTLQSRLEEFSRAVESGAPWTSILEFKGRELVAILDREGRIVYYRGPEEAEAQLAADAVWVQGPEGNRILREGEARVVAWSSLPGEGRVVATIPFALYSASLARELQGILLAAGVTLTAALILAIVFARNLSRPVTALTRIATTVPREWPRSLHSWHTDDEIGDLGRAFQTMLTDLRRGQEDLLEANQLLGQMVKERTRAMQDLATLLELSQLLSSTLEVEQVLEEVLTRVQAAVQADACSLMVLERQNLVPRAASGLDVDLPARPVAAGHPALRRALEGGEPVTMYDGPLLSPDGALRSLVAVPLRSRDQALGLLIAWFRQPRSVTGEAAALLRSVAGQAAVALAKARLFQEKDRVTELLRTVLRPRADLGFPGLEVGHAYIPSRDLSGDYFDLIPLTDRKVAVVIADVAGKGSEAAIEAVRIKHTVQSYATAGYRPGDVLRLLNEQVHRTARDLPRMVTVFYGELDLDQGTLTFSSAGHEPPLFWEEEDGEPGDLVTDGIVLGAIPEADYSERTVSLRAGSWIVLFTDGITEARSSESGELFGTERLLALVEPASGAGARRTAVAVERAVHEFTGGEVTDDLSLLILRCARVGSEPAADPDGRDVKPAGRAGAGPPRTG